MKTLITYSSKTNNTKKVATKLAEYSNAELIPMNELTSVEDYDLIFVGGWIDKGRFNDEANNFIETLENKVVAFFFTLGAYPNSVHAYNCINSIKDKLNQKNTVISHFHCQGPIDPNLMNWMKTLDKDHGHYPDKARIVRWEDASKHPNEEDYNSLFSFYQYTMKKMEQE